MPRLRDDPSPGLFGPSDQSRPARSAAPSVHPSSLLPSNLDAGLRALDDQELARLVDAVDRETKRRYPQLGAPSAAPAAPSPKKPAVQRKPMAASTSGIATAKANLIRAAFKAGLKPAMIARQLKIDPAVVRAVLAGEERKR